MCGMKSLYLQTIAPLLLLKWSSLEENCVHRFKDEFYYMTCLCDWLGFS